MDWETGESAEKKHICPIKEDFAEGQIKTCHLCGWDIAIGFEYEDE